MEEKTTRRRVFALMGISAVVLLLFVLRLVYLQLVKGEELLGEAESTTSYLFNITAARGEIVDRYGRSLASNATGYNVVLNKLMLGETDLNETVRQLVGILQASSESWNDTLLISYPDSSGGYAFTADGSEAAQSRLSTLKTAMKLQQYATADEVMAAIVREFELEDYAPIWQRVLGGVRYQMMLEEFSSSNNFTFATDVSAKTVATIREQSLTLDGVQIIETARRSYPDGTVLPHVLGSVGSILREQWRVTDENGAVSYPLRDKGYKMSDLIGQAGLEKVYEDRLRGSDGRMEIVRDSSGVIQSNAVIVEPKPGETLMLTVNLDFQKRVDEALEANILRMQQTLLPGQGQETNAGAVVVLDLTDNGILAMSNYPNYDLNLYNEQYSAYSADPGLPLFNRALQGQYTPGSTFKPAVALAALTGGIVTPQDTVECTGTYMYYAPTYTPGCLRYHRGVTNVDLNTALEYSCNIYFYDVGRRVGIDRYDAMANDLGLGVRTGVEINEAAGRLTHKEDENYTVGLEIQAAIGQGNTMVTPVQLATYASTIANNGTRWRTHLVAGFCDTNTGEIIEKTQPEIEAQIEDTVGAFAAVQQGMVSAAKTSSVLAGYAYPLAVKTGSPQRSEWYTSGGQRTYYTNTVMVAYGPVDDPEIAVAIVLEYGGGGANAAPLLVDIFNAYYFDKTSSLQPTGEGVLLP